VREIRMLRVMWRGLETEPRSALHGHERGNPGYGQEQTYRATAPVLDPTGGHLLIGRRSGVKGRAVGNRSTW
jgi:hypothetical protein